MAEQNDTRLRLADGEFMKITFLYDNCTKNKAQAGWVYYQFSCQEGRYSCNNHCVRAIQQAWPGRGGSMQIHRMSASAYEITEVVMGDSAPLGMKEWQDNGFEDIPFDLDGLSEAAPVEKPPVETPEAAEAPSQPRAASYDQTQGETLDDLVKLMRDCLDCAVEIWDKGVSGSIGGDVPSAIQRMAVTLYIDARKLGITGLPEEVLDDEARDDSGVTGGPNTIPIGEGQLGAPTPDNPGTEEDDDLPF